MGADGPLGELRELTRRLRAECPWDREQTARTIVPHTVEEAYEVADAAFADDPAKLLDELGDLLFQVFFLSLLLEEQGEGDLDDVTRAVHDKLVRRHPHVFGDAEARTAGRVRERWEAIKTEQEGREGVFHDVPELASGAPARAQRRNDEPQPSASTGPTSTVHSPSCGRSSTSCSSRSSAPVGPRPRPSPTSASRTSSVTCSSPSSTSRDS